MAEVRRVRDKLSVVLLAAAGVTLAGILLVRGDGSILINQYGIAYIVVVVLLLTVSSILARPRTTDVTLGQLRRRTGILVLSVATKVSLFVMCAAGVIAVVFAWIASHKFGQNPEWGYLSGIVTVTLGAVVMDFNPGAHIENRVKDYWNTVAEDLRDPHDAQRNRQILGVLRDEAACGGGWRLQARGRRYRRLSELVQSSRKPEDAPTQVTETAGGEPEV